MRKGRVFLVGGIICASEIIWHLYKKFFHRRKRSTGPREGKNWKKPKRNVSEMLFFSEESSFCQAHILQEDVCSKDACPIRHLRKLESYINNAEQSLDVCIYVMTCLPLSKAIVSAHKRGVHVRVITDRRMAWNIATQTSLFHKNGVELRFQPSDVLMHHKFTIVDNEVLITGSMNWTMTALFGNFENVLVTTDHSLVKPFVEEFQKLWIMFESPNCSES